MAEHRTATVTAPVTAPVTATVTALRSMVSPEYADVRDRRLAETLTAEDAAEQHGLDPLERLTCRTHRRWVHECVSSSLHVFAVTGHRWCRRCATAVNVSVDQLTWNVSLTCPRCGQSPEGAATRQIVRTCRASMAAARGHADTRAA